MEFILKRIINKKTLHSDFLLRYIYITKRNVDLDGIGTKLFIELYYYYL